MLDKKSETCYTERMTHVYTEKGILSYTARGKQARPECPSERHVILYNYLSTTQQKHSLHPPPQDYTPSGE